MSTTNNKREDLPAIPRVGDPLHRRVVDKSTSTVRYLIAHRAITLVPTKNPTNIQPYPGTVRFSVNEGDSTSSIIKIHAEDIYICAGSTFDFPGKTVLITANNIVLVNHQRHPSNTIVFNCSGPPGPDGDPTASKGNDGLGVERDGTFLVPTPGGVGPDGGPNLISGNSGGRFICSGKLRCSEKDPITFKVECNGGKGGRGPPGGTGGTGGKGWERKETAGIDFLATRETGYVPFVTGANGGKGGRGGRGAVGGNGGLILDLTSKKEPDLPKIKVESSLNPGAPGDAGPGGKGGLGGDGGYYEQKTFIGPNINLRGKGGSKGDDGPPGVSGPSDAKSGSMYGLAKPSQILLRPDIANSRTTDPIHVAMVLRRLHFEFQILYAAQPYSFINAKSSEPLEKEKAQFLETMKWILECLQLLKLSESTSAPEFVNKVGLGGIEHDWINAVFIQPWSTQENARKDVQTTYKQFLRRTRLEDPVDINNRRLFEIAEPNLALADLERSIDDLKVVEADKDKFFSAIQDIETAKLQTSRIVDSLKASMDKFEKDRKVLEKEMGQQYDKVVKARNDVLAKKEETITAVQSFWDTMSRNFSCKDLNAVLSAVGNVFLFAHGPTGALFKLGAALSIGAASNQVLSGDEMIDTAEGSINKDALRGQVYLLDANLRDDALLNKITDSNSKILKFSGGDQKFVNTIIADRDSFQNMCNKYFSDPTSPETQDKMSLAKAVFYKFVETAQTFHTVVSEYNQMASNYLKLLSDHESAKVQLGTLQAHNYNPSLPLFDLMFAFYSKIYEFQRARVTTFLFNAVHCCNGVFLRRSSILDDLFQLGAFEYLTADVLYAACTTRLADDIQKHKDTWNSYRPIDIPNHSTSIYKEDDKLMFKSLRENRRFLLRIDTKNALTQYKFEPFWFDIRLIDIRVYLIGATNFNDSADNRNSTVINVAIQMGDSFTVLDEERNDFTFYVPETTIDFTYNYGANKDNPERVSKAANKQLENFNFDLQLKDRSKLEFSSPMRSPICDYTISVGESVDLVDISEIRVEFDLRVRSRVVDGKKVNGVNGKSSK
ncbi:hypothetical protein CPB86DRAFT_785164 [Serendipita vermifera]|nr:hypothetical protein CPB86DRAFT_785164 [Serendipita vermifera]